MKILLLSCLFLIPALSQAQKKKDTKIIVAVSDTAGMLNKVALTFFEKGYAIDTKDPELKILSTKEKAIGSRSVKFRVMIKDSTITFSGDVANDVTLQIGGAKIERTFYEIYYGAMKGSDFRIAWDAMHAIAKEFGDRISYSK